MVLRDAVEVGEIRSLAARLGWNYVGDIDRDPERQVFYEAKWEVGGDVTAHYIVDELVDERYMVVAGDKESPVEDVVAKVEEHLDVWPFHDLLDEFDVSVHPAGQARSTLRLGAGSPLSADEEVLIRVRESAHHGDAAVREAALWAMVYAAWPEYRDDLAVLAGSDPVPEIARQAGLALRQLAEDGVIEP